MKVDYVVCVSFVFNLIYSHYKAFQFSFFGSSKPAGTVPVFIFILALTVLNLFKNKALGVAALPKLVLIHVS